MTRNITPPLSSGLSLLHHLVSGLARFFLVAFNHFLSLFRSLRRLSVAPRRPFFRPSLEGLETRWCPSTYHWSAAAAGNWNTAGDWQVWNPNTSHWDNTGLTPTNSDIAQFDGTSTKLCTVSASVALVELEITQASTGTDQIMIAAGQYLEAKLAWNKDNVQIGFGDTLSQLISDGGSTIQAFKFDGAKGAGQTHPRPPELFAVR
jgi:hypothetical protein